MRWPPWGYSLDLHHSRTRASYAWKAPLLGRVPFRLLHALTLNIHSHHARLVETPCPARKHLLRGDISRVCAISLRRIPFRRPAPLILSTRIRHGTASESHPISLSPVSIVAS